MTLILSRLLHDQLMQHLLARHGDLLDIRLAIQAGDHRRMQTLAQDTDELLLESIQSVRDELQEHQKMLLEEAIQEPLFRQRVKETVLEDFYGERISPPLHILPKPVSRNDAHHPANPSQGDGPLPLHAVCFEYLPNIINELYPLMVDSYVNDLSLHWRQRRCILGVNLDWINDDMRVERCIYYRPDADEIIETPLADPVAMESVHFLAISPEEHRRWSEHFANQPVFQLNPHQIAAYADDKYRCYQEWFALGTPTPPAMLLNYVLTFNDTALTNRLQEAFDLFYAEDDPKEIVLVVQPNRGTEGRGARAFTGPRVLGRFLERNPEVIPHIRAIARRDDVLIRRGLHNVLLLDPTTGQEVCFDLRINMACGRMESGFLMAASPGQVIASPGQGGHVLEWKPGIEWRIRIAGQTESILWDQTLWQIIRQTAEKAVLPFHECRLAGLDIRLEWKNDTLHAQVLDINPRPAGLTHSRYFDSCEPGVTQELWNALPN